MTGLTFLRDNGRWLAFGYLLTFFSGFGQTFFIALFGGEFRAEFGLTHGEFGLIYMLATLASAALLPLVGQSVDHYQIRTVAVWVVIGLSIFCFAMAGAQAAWMLFPIIFGLRLCGQGMMSHTAMTAMGRWFVARRGRAVAFAMLGLPTAEALLPLSFVALSSWAGWRFAWMAAAAVLVIVALPAVLLLLKSERHPKGASSEGEMAAGRHWTRAEVVRDPLFWMVCAGILAPPFIGTAIMFHQVYLVELRGWSLELFASAFIVMAAVSVLSSLVMGSLIDRFSASRLLPLVLVPIALGCLVLAVLHDPIAAYLFMALLGLSNGSTFTLIGAIWPEVYGTRHVGAIRSVAFALIVFASAAGPGVMGGLIDANVSYDVQLALMSLYCLAVTGLLTLVSRKFGLRLFVGDTRI